MDPRPDPLLPMDVEIVRAEALDDACASAWRALQSAEPAFDSPLLGPDFARQVGAVRDDAHVAVWRRAGQPIGFLPHHRRSGGFARPIGSPFCDYHALVSGADFPLRGPQALRSAGLSALQLEGLIDPFAIFPAEAVVSTPSYLVTRMGSVGTGPADFSRNQTRNHRRYSRKLEQDVGPLHLQAPDLGQASFEAVLRWKSGQLVESGMHDVLAPGWTRALMQRLFEQRTGPLQGLLIMLYAGERPVAGHFGVRSAQTYHPWIAAKDPALDGYSPGSLHLQLALGAMEDLGLTTYDLGHGADHWKQAFSNAVRTIGSGLATADTPAGRRHAAGHRLWTSPGLGRWPGTARLHRRLDTIAASELTASGRLAGVVHAASGLRRQARRHAGETS